MKLVRAFFAFTKNRFLPSLSTHPRLEPVDDQFTVQV